MKKPFQFKPYRWPYYVGLLLLLQLFPPKPICAHGTQTDSLLSVLGTLPEGEKRLDVLIELADLLNWQDLEKAKAYGFEALRLGKRLGDPIRMGYAMIEISHNYDSYMNQDSARYYAIQAIELFRKKKHPAGEAQGHLRLGYMAENNGEFEKATREIFEALRLFESSDDKIGLDKAFIALGKLYFKMDRFEEGIAIMQKAEYSTTPDAPDELKGYYHLVMGNNYKGAKRFEEALYHYNACAEIALTNNFNIDLIYTNTFMADIYQEQGAFEKARQFYQEAIEYAKVYKDKNLETFPYIGSGRLYNKQGQHKLAIAQFEAAMKTKFDRVHNYYFHEIYRELSVAHKGLGQYDTALQHMSTYSSLRDSFFTERADRLQSEMQAKYQTEKQEEAFRQKQKELSFAIAIVILLAWSAIALWRAYLIKRRSNRVLEQSNEEKEFLIKEIHHRVNNNLQVLSSLLNLQADHIQDPAALDAVADGRNRVQTIGLIHQRLYLGENLASVRMEDYVQDLTNQLLASFGVEERIEIKTFIEIPPLDIDSAVPLGLVINELLTNALKHAFPGNKAGVIEIKLWIDSEELLCLQVADNGVGVVEKPRSRQSTSFGIELVKILSKKLKGQVSISSSKGYQTSIRFHRYKLGKYAFS
ncbi:MAG: tetratricopeptide repeat protein [Saprospiraceae bacterium]|nr:tetratricopeptide repeat protein [Saprospiraceae bacterium]